MSGQIKMPSVNPTVDKWMSLVDKMLTEGAGPLTPKQCETIRLAMAAAAAEFGCCVLEAASNNVNDKLAQLDRPV